MQLVRLLQVPMRILQVELCSLLIDVQTCTATTNAVEHNNPAPSILCSYLDVLSH